MTKAKLLAAVAGAAMLGLGGVGTANAIPVYGYAELSVTNFQLIIPQSAIVGTPVVQGTDGANYPGFAPTSNSASGDIGNGVNTLQATSGPGPFPPENTFTQQMLVNAGTRGDQQIQG